MAPDATATDIETTDRDPGFVPRPIDNNARRSLNGHWAFAPGPADSPPGEAADWRRHEVPNQWNTQGYEVPDGSRGWYRRTVTVPPSWLEGRVFLRVGAAYSDAVVRVNNETIGSHVGGYTPFEFDVTEALNPGDSNVITVGVAEASRADDISQASPGAGIVRGVSLFAVPACHLTDVDVRTTLDDETATVTIAATVRNANESGTDATWHMSLSGPDGETIRTSEDRVSLEPGESCDVQAALDVTDPVTWDPERPRLHDISVSLHEEGECHKVTERVGLREVTVEGNQLLVNGESITLRGVNWRESDAEGGIAVPEAATRRDAEALRAANVNYVRTGHHPPSEAFVEACDELGIIVEMEAPIAFLRFENEHLADDPAYRDVLCRQAVEIVARDKNHPSVCIWSLANESDWGENFQAVANAVRAADPTRPVTFNWGMYLDDAEEAVDIANHHYPALRDSKVDTEDFRDFDRPVLFDEFAHTYCYDGRELATDPGLRDDYVRVLEACWDEVTDLDACAGAAIWAGLDHHTPEFRWGVIDRHRCERPEYWHVKKVYAPVTVSDPTWGPEGLTVTVHNGATFADLAERTLTWSADGEEGAIDATAAPGESIQVSLPVPETAEDATLRVLHPAGFAVNVFDFHRDPDPAPVKPIGDANPTVSRTDAEVTVRTEAGTLSVDRRGGAVTIAPLDGEPVVSGLFAVIATPPQDDVSVPPAYGRPMNGRLSPWRCEDVTATEDGAVEIAGGYYYDTINVASGQFRVEPEGDAFVISSEFELHEDREMRELGISLSLSPALDTLSWTRDARWRGYPEDHVGRPRGTAHAATERATDASDLDRTRSWAGSASERGTRDFRSTKRNVHVARLTDSDGRGVEILGDGESHVRFAADDDATRVAVLNRSLAGVGLELLDRHALLDEDPTVPAGTTLSESVTLRVHGQSD